MRKRTAPKAAFTIALAAIAFLAATVATGCGGSGKEGPFSKPVTFSGVGSVNLVMSIWDVKKAAGAGSAGLIEPEGSTFFGTMEICSGETHGVGYFPVGKLLALWFSSGAKTDRGVGVGSTRSEVKRAYGKALRSFSDSENKNSLFVVGPKQKNYTPDIVFVVGPTPQSKVALLGLVVEGASIATPPFAVTASTPEGNWPVQVLC